MPKHQKSHFFLTFVLVEDVCKHTSKEIQGTSPKNKIPFKRERTFLLFLKPHSLTQCCWCNSVELTAKKIPDQL